MPRGRGDPGLYVGVTDLDQAYRFPQREDMLVAGMPVARKRRDLELELGVMPMLSPLRCHPTAQQTPRHGRHRIYSAGFVVKSHPYFLSRWW